jgi:hypothetical protein
VGRTRTRADCREAITGIQAHVSPDWIPGRQSHVRRGISQNSQVPLPIMISPTPHIHLSPETVQKANLRPNTAVLGQEAFLQAN